MHKNSLFLFIYFLLLSAPERQPHFLKFLNYFFPHLVGRPNLNPYPEFKRIKLSGVRMVVINPPILKPRPLKQFIKTFNHKFSALHTNPFIFSELQYLHCVINLITSGPAPRCARCEGSPQSPHMKYFSGLSFALLSR